MVLINTQTRTKGRGAFPRGFELQSLSEESTGETVLHMGWIRGHARGWGLLLPCDNKKSQLWSPRENKQSKYCCKPWHTDIKIGRKIFIGMKYVSIHTTNGAVVPGRASLGVLVHSRHVMIVLGPLLCWDTPQQKTMLGEMFYPRWSVRYFISGWSLRVFKRGDIPDIVALDMFCFMYEFVYGRWWSPRVEKCVFGCHQIWQQHVVCVDSTVCAKKRNTCCLRSAYPGEVCYMPSGHRVCILRNDVDGLRTQELYLEREEATNSFGCRFGPHVRFCVADSNAVMSSLSYERLVVSSCEREGKSSLCDIPAGLVGQFFINCGIDFHVSAFTRTVRAMWQPGMNALPGMVEYHVKLSRLPSSANVVSALVLIFTSWV